MTLDAITLYVIGVGAFGLAALVRTLYLVVNR